VGTTGVRLAVGRVATFANFSCAEFVSANLQVAVLFQASRNLVGKRGFTMGGITDPIADYLTQIRNASTASKESVTVARGSKLTVKLTEILKQEGLIGDFKVIEDAQICKGK
jgi:hypothetical protein